jgi:hypothetical protein
VRLPHRVHKEFYRQMKNDYTSAKSRKEAIPCDTSVTSLAWSGLSGLNAARIAILNDVQCPPEPALGWVQDVPFIFQTSATILKENLPWVVK